MSVLMACSRIFKSIDDLHVLHPAVCMMSPIGVHVHVPLVIAAEDEAALTE